MIDWNSPAYTAGRFIGRIILIGLGYIVRKCWGRRTIDKGFPEKK